jgi:hypothetical protein
MLTVTKREKIDVKEKKISSFTKPINVIVDMFGT